VAIALPSTKSLTGLSRNFIAQRGMAACVSFATTIVVARLAGPAQFGRVAFFIFLTRLLLCGRLGAEQGYVLCTSQKTSSRLLDCPFTRFHAMQLVIVALFFMAVSLYVDTVYLYAAIAFLLLVPFHAIEPACRVNQRYSAALIPDLIVNLTLLLSVSIGFLVSSANALSSNAIILRSIAMIPVSYAILPPLLRGLSPSGRMHSQISWASLTDYLSILRLGLPAYLAGVFFSLFLLTDRSFLKSFYPADWLGVYMLAYQVSVGCCLPLIAMSFTSCVEIGRSLSLDGNAKQVFSSYLRRAVGAGAAAFALIVSISFILETQFLKRYEGLTQISVVLGLGLTAFHASASVTPIVFHRGKQLTLTLALVAALVLLVVGNIVLAYFSPSLLRLVTCTAFWLGGYAFFSAWLAWKTARAQPKGACADAGQRHGATPRLALCRE
jgi:O-antigen/teichoic acid export membrane protein